MTIVTGRGDPGWLPPGKHDCSGVPGLGPEENGNPALVIQGTSQTEFKALVQKITPFLWFDNNAEEAMKFYTSVFKNSKIGKVTLYPKGSPGPAGTVMVGAFQIEGQEFIALNGGPVFKFTEAISFVVNCETQEEVDEYWKKLTAGGGKEVECGWLKDKFGLSWQIVPTILGRLLEDKDPEKSKRVMQAMLKMKKIDIEGLKRAYAQP
jgi:predicted 3-demethylubiquinone-9 3-methyltransferase (glyoxalase superfamily)